jgi:calcineurin-like phosphoesterase family protein
MTGHKKSKTLYDKGKYHWVTSFKILQYEDAYIELLEAYPCNSKDELCKREGELIRTTEHCINKRIEGRTKPEYYQDNKAEINMKCKEYYDNNKDKIKQHVKEYYDNNQDKIKQYRVENKAVLNERCRQYRLDNLEKEKARHKAYREKNKAQIKARNGERITCECGKEINRQSISRHKRSNKHQTWLTNQE